METPAAEAQWKSARMPMKMSLLPQTDTCAVIAQSNCRDTNRKILVQFQSGSQ